MSPGHLSAKSKNLTYALEGRFVIPGYVAIIFFADYQVRCSCFPHVALFTLNSNSRINRLFPNRNCVWRVIPWFTFIWDKV